MPSRCDWKAGVVKLGGIAQKISKWVAPLVLVLVLVLVLGVSASSLNLRVANSIPGRKMARWRLNCEAMPCKSLGHQSEDTVQRKCRSCEATAGVPLISGHNNSDRRFEHVAAGIPGGSNRVAPLRLEGD
jgi:hypothetical protein